MIPSDPVGREATLAVAADASPWSTRAGAAYVPDPEELRDLCSLLSLADRVLIASSDADAIAARLLGVVLEDLGFFAQVVNARTIPRVDPYDTVVAVCSAEVDPALIHLLRPALQARAALLAVTVSRRSALLPLADAAITVPGLPDGGPAAGQTAFSVGFDLRLIVAVDAIRRDLESRRFTPC
jgi:DNA-binding MurR/RpiR family transcriptional regulator